MRRRRPRIAPLLLCAAASSRRLGGVRVDAAASAPSFLPGGRVRRSAAADPALRAAAAAPPPRRAASIPPRTSGGESSSPPRSLGSPSRGAGVVPPPGSASASDDGGLVDGGVASARGRRAALSALASAAAAASVPPSLASHPPPALSATEPPGPTTAATTSASVGGGRLWTSTRPQLDDDDATYPDSFVNLLTRFLLTYDRSIRSWWTSQADLVVVASAPPPRAGGRRADAPPSEEETARRGRAEQFESLEVSVRAALEGRGGRFEGPGGAEELLGALLRSYGDEGESASMRLCGIFALLDADDQPSELIAERVEGPPPPPTTPSDLPPDPAPPVVLPPDRELVELPRGLRPLRPENSTEPFEPVTDSDTLLSNLAGLLRRGGGEGRDGTASSTLLPPPVTSERSLDPLTYARFFAAGALASGSAHAALTPVDMIKTRIQTQPDKYGHGPASAAALILKEEGPGAFARGLGPTAVGYFLGGSVAFGGTELLKRLGVHVLGPRFALSNPFLLVLVCGGLAVSACDLLVVPFEAARIRTVDDPDYASSLPAALGRLIDEEGGFLGLYRGLPALLVKDVPFHATKFAVYDAASTALRASPSLAAALPGAALTVVAGAAAGVAAAVVSQPADATFTRCNRPSGGAGAGAGAEGGSGGGTLTPLEAFRDLMEGGGIGSGLSSRCVFGAALVSLQFLFYSAGKATFRVTAGDLSLFLDAFAGLTLNA